MGTSLYSIQKSIRDELANDSQLKELITGVFDEVLQDKTYPLIQVGEPTESRFDTFDRIGKDVTFPILIWSNYKGFKEAYQILDRVNELLDYQEIQIDNYTTVYIRAEEVNAFRDDREFRQVVANFRVIVQEVGDNNE